MSASGSAATEQAAAFKHCEAITRQRARNFYYGLRLAPEPQRSALFAMYAWMRRADDLIDASSLGEDERRTAIDTFMAATDNAFAGSLPSADDDPMWIAFAGTAQRFPIRREQFREMIDGQLDDLKGDTYESFEELESYCYRVASTVGLICVEIWGYSDPVARQHAIERGIAFQLTNILRDLREDHDRGRVYLPAELFRKHNLTIDHVLAWSPAVRCADLVLEVVERAEARYAASAPLDMMITPSCLPTLWAMTRIYHGLLEQVRERPERVSMERRLRLSSFRKGAIALRAKFMASVSHGNGRG
jgi:phytoene synthase